MKKVRIKTEEEFVREFGGIWNACVRNYWDKGRMDYLHGKSIPCFLNKTAYDGWMISEDMVTDKWAEGTWVECLVDCLVDCYADFKKGDARQIEKTKISDDGFLQIELSGRFHIIKPNESEFKWHPEEPVSKTSFEEKWKPETTTASDFFVPSFLNSVDLEKAKTDMMEKEIQAIVRGHQIEVERDYRSGIFSLEGGISPEDVGLGEWAQQQEFQRRLSMAAWRPSNPLFKEPNRINISTKRKKKKTLNLKIKQK